MISTTRIESSAALTNSSSLSTCFFAGDRFDSISFLRTGERERFLASAFGGDGGAFRVGDFDRARLGLDLFGGEAGFFGELRSADDSRGLVIWI